MKRKRLISAVLFGCALIVCAGGCNITDFSAENLLRPPKAIGDEAEIEQIIANTADSDYVLKYPKSGSYRSAIITADLDGDDRNEAVAFFGNSDDTSSVHMLVMYSDGKSWKTASDNVLETADIDSVDFADVNGSGSLEIILSVTTYTPNVNKLLCYSYSDGKTAAVSASQNCSSFITGDFDDDGTNEIMTLLLYTTENEALASMLDYNSDNKTLYSKAVVNMDPNIVKYKNIAVTEFEDGVTGVAVDGSSSSDITNTQVIFYSKELAILRNPLYKEKSKNITSRSSSLVCTDVDKDGILEIPVTFELPKQDDDGVYADKIVWNGFNSQKESLVTKQTAAINYDYMFMVSYPSKWEENKVTAKIDADSNTTAFYALNGEKLGEKLFEIKVTELGEWEAGHSDNLTLISKDDKYAYSFDNINPDTQVSLSDDEIKTGFSVLDLSGV